MEVEIQNSIHESTVILASGKISQPCWLTPSFWKSIIYKMGLSFIPWHSQLYCSGHLLFSCSVVSLCDPMDSVVSDSLWPHGLQHSRLPCLSSSPRAYSNSCPLSQWCHPTILSPVVPFLPCFQSFPASGSFPMSPFFASGGQSIVASASVLPMNIQNWSPLGWTAWISLQSKGLSRVFSNTTVQKHQFFGAQLSLQSNSHIHTWLLEKP